MKANLLPLHKTDPGLFSAQHVVPGAMPEDTPSQKAKKEPELLPAKSCNPLTFHFITFSKMML